ncbi:hypothetical protein PFICI_12183 [Pestalotiopsis fici W106-1]|uniref:Uncharacterized protein n=1 Tax=Pestalotiopsis fici (strain W106-1 / CGMCC3.15140) TaxID=1229662 RepID=W3WVD0_PESFW|nr:uncharacterized protein PFICI_12183 [Pestalotiopsis fici W106-1]ETS76796.1 hypothetical protein PFICI_12183 [Pestalotiopsis fici W106-1]
MLLFPRPSALKDIYGDPSMNLKSELYGTGALGPPALFSTRDGKTHQLLRKALGGSQWSIGFLKKTWEDRIDDQVNLFVEQMAKLADGCRDIVLSDKVAEFAADIITMVSFTQPWGFVRNGRDERGLLESWRIGLPFFGLAGRWRWFRQNIIANDALAKFFLPKMSDKKGMGYLYVQADREVSSRERKMQEEGGSFLERPDYLQYCVEARDAITGQNLTPIQKRAHVTLLIQAGADTTATALGSTLRFLLMHPRVLEKVKAEVDTADAAGKLSNPIAYEESRQLLPYFGACIKESLRLNPPAPNLFARVVPPDGKTIDGVFVPGHTEVTSVSYIVQRDPVLYSPDPEAYRPERWVEQDADKLSEMEASQFVFGTGPRVCLGKDIATMELWKLLPQIIRSFDIQLVEKGSYIVAGGVAYNQGLIARLTLRAQAGK